MDRCRWRAASVHVVEQVVLGDVVCGVDGTQIAGSHEAGGRRALPVIGLSVFTPPAVTEIADPTMLREGPDFEVGRDQ